MTLATDPVLYDGWALLIVVCIAFLVALIVKYRL